MQSDRSARNHRSVVCYRVHLWVAVQQSGHLASLVFDLGILATAGLDILQLAQRYHRDVKRLRERTFAGVQQSTSVIEFLH